MSEAIAALRASVAAQRERLPKMYGSVDFSATPERFTDDMAVRSSLQASDDIRRKLLEDKELLEIMRTYTLLGDAVADAYAALAPQLGMRKLIKMLMDACDKGLEAVPDAPPELVAFIEAMERTPDWIDMSLVHEGARLSRNAVAHTSPFLIRGAFFATFLNEYAALPMAMTGTLSSGSAARRIFETATFFAVMTLPGALEHRGGGGFKAAAMVRLMHSMVRFNILTRPMGWNLSKYGIPIPQVDQMPAGLITATIAARAAHRRGLKEFGRDDRARVEFARYQCFLLGLPKELLGTTPRELLRLSAMRAATLRDSYKDETCGALMRATMQADLFDDSLMGKVCRWIEPGFAKVFCSRNFLFEHPERAKQMGVAPSTKDYLSASAAVALMAGQIVTYNVALRLPVIKRWADASLVRKINQLLAHYGHADFTTDADAYRPAQAA